MLEKKKINYDSLVKYGFIQQSDGYYLEQDIMNHEFKVVIIIKHDEIYTKIIEKAFDEEYLMGDVNNVQGSYIGQIKDEYNKLWDDIDSKCLEYDVFKDKESQLIINYIREKYHDELEYLWEKTPEYAIFRNHQNHKWYGLLMQIPKKRIVGDSEELIEVINVRYDKDKINDIIDNKHIFPGYHMNKKSWITIILDNYNWDDLKKLIDYSYQLVEERR